MRSPNSWGRLPQVLPQLLADWAKLDCRPAGNFIHQGDQSLPLQ